MARNIDADVVTKRFRGWLESPHEKNAYNSGFDDALWRVLDVIDHTPTLTQPNEPLVTGFDVVDTKTGKYPELEKIALKEDWAKHLMYCDMEGFAIEEDGTLLLLDECGRQACCPAGRFEIRHLQEGDAECLSTSCL